MDEESVKVGILFLFNSSFTKLICFIVKYHSSANIYFDYNSSVDEIILQYSFMKIYYPYFPFIIVELEVSIYHFNKIIILK